MLCKLIEKQNSVKTQAKSSIHNLYYIIIIYMFNCNPHSHGVPSILDPSRRSLDLSNTVDLLDSQENISRCSGLHNLSMCWDESLYSQEAIPDVVWATELLAFA